MVTDFGEAMSVVVVGSPGHLTWERSLVEES